MKKKRSRWVFLSLAIFFNSFILFYSALPASVASDWNWFVTNIFSNIINSMTGKTVVEVPMTSLEVFLSNEASYKYNYLPGYEVSEIPLGSVKQVEVSYGPGNTTDSSIEYYTTDKDKITINQSGSKATIVGMEPGLATVSVRNKMSGLESSIQVNVVDTVEPEKFDILVTTNTVQLGDQLSIDFDIDGGNLGHNELINFRYYDTRKLTYVSSDENVLTVDENAVIYPVGIGNAIVTVSNQSGVSKTIDIEVINGQPQPAFTDLKIVGSDVCFNNDMINDQSSHANHFQMQIFDGETELNPEDFVWYSSDELLAKIDKHGVLRGFRKKLVEDENVIITATSKITGQTVEHIVKVREEPPTKMDYYVECGNRKIWNANSFTVCVGDNVVLKVLFDKKIADQSLTITLSNKEALGFTNQGSTVSLHIFKEGECKISFYSNSYPDFCGSITLTLLKAGAINNDNIDNVTYGLRKVVGHAFMFFVAQIFTVIALIMFLGDKKKCIVSAISLGLGLFIAIITEIEELFVPHRFASVTDVLIDMSGVLIAFTILYFVWNIFIKRRTKNKE